MAQYDDLNARQIWAVGIVSAALTVVTVLAIQVLYYALLSRHNDVKLGGSEYRVSNAYLAAEAEQINRYGRDAETGAVRIPIERAMTLVAERSAKSAEADEPEKATEKPEPAAEKPEPAAEKKEAPAAEKKEAPAAEKKEAPAAEKKEAPAEEKKEAPAEEEESVEEKAVPANEASDESAEPTTGDDES